MLLGALDKSSGLIAQSCLQFHSGGGWLIKGDLRHCEGLCQKVFSKLFLTELKKICPFVTFF